MRKGRFSEEQTVAIIREPDRDPVRRELQRQVPRRCLSLEWFRSRAEAKVLIEEWRRHFNEVRPHSSLGYLTPNEFVVRGASLAPRHATGRDAAVCGASAPRPVAQPSPRDKCSNRGKPSQAKRGPKNLGVVSPTPATCKATELFFEHGPHPHVAMEF
jgi:Integrase core domain